MPGLVTTCRRCGAAFTPSRTILPSQWRLCPRCRDAPPPTGAVAIEPAACNGCGRSLRAGQRTVCGRCLGLLP